MGAQAERIFPIFFGVWILLGVFSAAFYLLCNNAALKRKVHPPFVIGVSVLFLCFVVLMDFPHDAFFFCLFVPMIVVLTFLNIRNTKFCSACGKTLFSQNPFVPPKFCSKCGANLENDNA